MTAMKVPCAVARDRERWTRHGTYIAYGGFRKIWVVRCHRAVSQGKPAFAAAPVWVRQRAPHRLL